jgi:hypothetical protein
MADPISRPIKDQPVAVDQPRLSALLAQLDRIEDRADPFDALDWDARGLPP